MSTVATMQATTALPEPQADPGVASSTPYRSFKRQLQKTREAEASSKDSAASWKPQLKSQPTSSTKDSADDPKSQLKSQLANWIAKWTASPAGSGVKEATITEEEMMSNLQFISDLWDKHATILPEGVRVQDHFSWQPTDDPDNLSYLDGMTKEDLAKVLSDPDRMSVTMVRHGETYCNRYAMKEAILRQLLGSINYNDPRHQAMLPEVTLMDKDRSTVTRRLTSFNDRNKLISEAALTKTGYDQAAAMGDVLRSGFPGTDDSDQSIAGIKHWYISRLPRTKQTLFAMYGLEPDDHVVGDKSGTIPGTSVTYSSISGLDECASRHGGHPAMHRDTLQQISEDSKARGINRIGVVSHGNNLSGLWDNVLNTAPTKRSRFSNCQANTALVSRGALSEQEESIRQQVEDFRKGIASETTLPTSKTPTQSALSACNSAASDNDLLSMMVPVGPMISAGA